LRARHTRARKCRPSGNPSMQVKVVKGSHTGIVILDQGMVRADGRPRPGATFHSLCHTHPSHLIASGLDVITISRRLGHGSHRSRSASTATYIPTLTAALPRSWKRAF
jgi:site-specific recombinase XerD